MTTTLESIKALAPFALPNDVYEVIAVAYASPGRAYHTLTHVLEVARHFHVVAASIPWARPNEVFAAVLFHDAVYDVTRFDNESRSASLAAKTLASTALELQRVEDFIESTAWHGRVDGKKVDLDTAHFLDCDMAILGASPEAFARYDDEIFREYADIVGHPVYLAGRRAFCERLIASPAIFLTPFFRDRFEQQARENLARWLAAH